MNDRQLPGLRRIGLCGIAALFMFVVGATPARAQAPPPITILSGPNLGTVPIGELEYQLFATGGNGTYTWQVVSGALPPGVSLRVPPDLAPWFSPTANAGLIGVATTPGPYAFTLRVTSGTQTLDAPFTIKVTSLASDDSFSLPNAFVGEPFSFSLTASGNSGPVTFAPSGTMPPGLSISSSGVLAGTPTTAGFFNVSFSMTDANGTVFRGTSVSVFGLHITTPALLPNAPQNVPYLAHIDVVGGVAPYHFDTGNSLPFGFVLDPNTGDISGSPTSSTFATRYTLFVTVTDANHVSFSKSLALSVVTGQPQVGEILPYGTQWDDCTLGNVCRVGISGFQGRPPNTWAASGLPSGFSLRFGSATDSIGDAEIVGVARAVGTFNIHVMMTDADGITVSNDFPLHVSSLMLPDGLLSGTINQPYAAHLRIIGGTAPYTVSIIDGALPAGLSLDAQTLNITGTPVESGSFGFTLRITDAAGNTLAKSSRGLFIAGGGGTYGQHR